jgi:hypothetical protein
VNSAPALAPSDEQVNFKRVAALNEAAKELIARSYQVNLLALDAMVQSKRGGSSLRGFDEVSSQMRRWSRDLHADLERLAALSRQVVAEVSTASKEGHLLRLLERAALSSSHETARETLVQRQAIQQDRSQTLVRLWRKVVDVLGDLDQLGMMAVVLSRSAMIEASSGGAEQRAQLGHVSQEFYRNSEIVVNVLKTVLKEMKRSK